jgi:hypothetical protein
MIMLIEKVVAITCEIVTHNTCYFKGPQFFREGKSYLRALFHTVNNLGKKLD